MKWESSSKVNLRYRPTYYEAFLLTKMKAASGPQKGLQKKIL